MKYDRRQPCNSCPYRKDAKLGFWHKEHFLTLLANNRNEMHGALYMCHEDGKKPEEERGFCIGWLLDQKSRGVPLIPLRLHLMTSEEARKQYNEVNALKVRLWPSLEQMCMANLRAIEKPPKARRRKKAG